MGTVLNPDFYNPDQQNTDQSGNGTPAASTGPSSPGTANSVPSTSTLSQNTSSPSAAPTQRTASSGFTNLKQYITANQGNNLANTVTSGAQTQLNSANQNLKEGQDTFNTGLADQAARIQAAAGQANNALNYIQTGNNAPSIPDQAPTAVTKPTDLRAQMTSDDPTAYAAAKTDYDKQLAAYNDYQTKLQSYNDAQNKAAQNSLSNLKTLNYSGPTGLNNLDKINNANTSVQDFAGATGTDTGRAAILQNLFGRNGQYSAGTQNFDNLLLGSNQDNLNKLQGIRQQAATLGQNINQAQQATTAGVGSVQGQLGTTKAQEDFNMKALRDQLLNDLQNQATTTNAQNQNKVASGLTTQELADDLRNIAGYDLTNAPTSTSTGLNGQVQLGIGGLSEQPTRNPDGTISGPVNSNASVLPTTDFRANSTPLDALHQYINLYSNKDFAPEDKVDPNATFTRNIGGVGGGFGAGSGRAGGSSSGKPNDQQVYVGINDLKPLFNQTYQDNNWQSVNANELNRRNLLSNVIGDNSANGLVTPQTLNTIQTNTNTDLLEKLKQTPKMVQDKYNSDIESGAPGTTAITALQHLPDSTDPFKYMQDLGIAVGESIGPGGTGLARAGEYYDPKQQLVILPGSPMKYPAGTPVGPGMWNYNGEVWGPGQMKTNDYIQKILLGPGSTVSWNNNQSPASVADALKQKYILDRLNSLGIANPTIKIGS